MTNILGGNQTILRIQRLQKKKYGEEASTNEASNQMIQQPIYKRRYYDKNKAML